MEGHGMVFQNSSMAVLIHYPFAGRLGEAVPAVRSFLVRRSNRVVHLCDEQPNANLITRVTHEITGNLRETGWEMS